MFDDGGVFVENAADPSNPCLSCQPFLSTTEWLPQPTVIPCDGGMCNLLGACIAACDVNQGNVFWDAGLTDANNPCSACLPAVSIWSLSALPDGTPCEAAGMACSGGNCGPGCTIGGQLYGAGAVNAQNACQTCQPSVSQTSWSGTLFEPYYAVQTEGTSLVVADFNNDGLSDLATETWSILNGGAIIILASPDGGFEPPVTYSLSPLGQGFNAPAVTAAGDLNGDGWPDLVVFDSQESYTLGLLMGTGGGALGVAERLTTSDLGGPVALGNLGGSGFQDILYGGRTAQLFINDGGGGFAAGPTFDAGGPVAIADFNRDGLLDFAAATYPTDFPSLALVVYLAQRDGGFLPQPPLGVGLGVVTLAVADFNRDGWPDLAICSLGASGFQVLLNGTDGGFVPGPMLPTSLDLNTAITTADVNGDGLPDVIVFDTDGMGVLLNRWDGGALSFAPEQHFAAGVVAGSDSQVATGDFNGDGRIDVAVATANPNGGINVFYGCQ